MAAIFAPRPSRSTVDGNQLIQRKVDPSQLVPVYGRKGLPIESGQEMVRLETKRGCEYSCAFCAHRMGNSKIVDPLFQAGKGKHQFLGRIAEGNYHLEFGLQTIIENELRLIGRNNQRKKIERCLAKLKEKKISYEVSLIYGLPEQSVESFQKSVDFLKDAGCSRIAAYPLMLLSGTRLHDRKEKLLLHEEHDEELGLKVVKSSRSFDRNDWMAMKQIADSLKGGSDNV